MSTAAVTPSPTSDISLLASLTDSSTSSNPVVTDLSNYTQAKGADNSTVANAAIGQLRKDLAAEEDSFVSSLMDSSSSSHGNVGNNLLSSIFNLTSSRAKNSASASR